MTATRPASRLLGIGSGLAGLVVCVGFTARSGLTLAQFSWSFWLVGLYSAWVSVSLIAVRLVLHRDRTLRSTVPFLAATDSRTLLGVSIAPAGAAALALWYAATFVYGFYGIMLSAWVPMEPEELLGRNGFINSDFWTPVTHLTRLYWPMLAGQALSEVSSLLAAWSAQPTEPGRDVSPANGLERRIVTMHLIVLALPIVSLVSYALVGPAYETLGAIVLVVAKGVFDLRRPRTGQPDGVAAEKESTEPAD